MYQVTAAYKASFFKQTRVSPPMLLWLWWCQGEHRGVNTGRWPEHTAPHAQHVPGTATPWHVSRDRGRVSHPPCPGTRLWLRRSGRPSAAAGGGGLTAQLHCRYPLPRRAAALRSGGRRTPQGVRSTALLAVPGCRGAHRPPPARPAPRPPPAAGAVPQRQRAGAAGAAAGPGRGGRAVREHGPGGAAVRRAALRRPQPLQPAGRAVAARHALHVDRRPASPGPHR